MKIMHQSTLLTPQLTLRYVRSVRWINLLTQTIYCLLIGSNLSDIQTHILIVHRYGQFRQTSWKVLRLLKASHQIPNNSNVPYILTSRTSTSLGHIPQRFASVCDKYIVLSIYHMVAKWTLANLSDSKFSITICHKRLIFIRPKIDQI